ncbi:MAG: 50S ribosomal protein L10 [Oscillospiraceae bacterium]|nr:50S ribosomal protein L10 [Oscillospiraceae bacterium]
MPSEKILAEKKKIVEDMTESLKSQAGVFVDYKGITVIEDTEMRVKMRDANVNYKVIRNRLMKLAIKNVGFDDLESILTGTTSLAISKDDPIAPARIVKEYADKLPDYFEIKAGFMDGKVLSADEVKAIASIPALPVLQAQFLGTMLAPITSLAIVLKAIAEKDGAPADVEVKAEPEKPAEKAPEAKAEAKAEASEEKPAAEEKSEAAEEKPVEAEKADAAEAAAEDKPAEEAVKAETKEAAKTDEAAEE